jgi:hypothetical protein
MGIGKNINLAHAFFETYSTFKNIAKVDVLLRKMSLPTKPLLSQHSERESD